jgi:hypothetical protein
MKKRSVVGLNLWENHRVHGLDARNRFRGGLHEPEAALRCGLLKHNPFAPHRNAALQHCRAGSDRNEFLPLE